MTRKPKLCIISPWNYPLFNPECQTHFGGWEVRIALIAKELAKRSTFQVNLVIGDHGQSHVEQRDGVTLYSWQGRTIWGISPKKLAMGTPTRQPTLLTRFRSKLGTRLSALKSKYAKSSVSAGQVGSYFITSEMLAVYDEIKADLYMAPGNSPFATEVAFYCQQRSKPYIFLAGSDFDFYPEYKLYPEKKDIYGVPFAIKTFAIESAHAHIVQSERQAELLCKGYSCASVVIKNPIDLPQYFPRNSAAQNILWVGKSDERVKRPALILELARRLPEYPFVVIMNFAVAKTHTECVELARQLPNVTMVERVPFAEIESYFANARLHLNTSLFEGFPNTFLQAAKYGVPTVSMQVDPGGMLATYGSGLACHEDFEKFKANVCALMMDTDLYDRLSRQAMAYVRAYHDKDLIIPQYESALLAVLKQFA